MFPPFGVGTHVAFNFCIQHFIINKITEVGVMVELKARHFHKRVLMRMFPL